MPGGVDFPITTVTGPSAATVTVTTTIVQLPPQEQGSSASPPAVNAEPITVTVPAPSLSSFMSSVLSTASINTKNDEVTILTVTVTTDLLTTVTRNEQSNKSTAMPNISQYPSSVQLKTSITSIHSTMPAPGSSTVASPDSSIGNTVSSGVSFLGSTLPAFPQPASRMSGLYADNSSLTTSTFQPSPISPSKPPITAATATNQTSNNSDIASRTMLGTSSSSQGSGSYTNGTWAVSMIDNNGTAMTANQSDRLVSVVRPTGRLYTATNFPTLANFSSYLALATTINTTVTAVTPGGNRDRNVSASPDTIGTSNASNTSTSSSKDPPSGITSAIVQVSVGIGQRDSKAISGSSSGNRAVNAELSSTGSKFSRP